MLDPKYDIENPVEGISSFLMENLSGVKSIRRRAVIYKEKDCWVVHACVVEGISAIRGEVTKQSSRIYSNACLFEDWLSLEKLKKFINQISAGKFRLGKYSLEATSSFRGWSCERLPLSNDEMPFAGYVWKSRFSDNVYGMRGELLMPKQPYYPDLLEAARDWLPYPVYHGSHDSRKGEISFLLPETRAYFLDVIPSSDSIELHIAGVDVENLELEVKGAWWDKNGIRHFTEDVVNGRAHLNVPSSANRLEYVLLDVNGTVYDFQKEDGNRHTGLGRNSKSGKDRTLVSLVSDACRNGEGPKIEFKPFIYPDNAKLNEVVRTVVAFANTEGGKIFLGINDGCELTGVDSDLGNWATEEADEKSCERYIGEIKSRIRDQLSEDVDIDFNQIVVRKSRVIVIEVNEAKNKPVTTRKEEKLLYIRRGASNVKASPSEWVAICKASTNIPMLGNSWIINQ